MKTAIELLILEFEELKKTKLYENSFKAIDDCIDLAYSKVELEKKQKLTFGANCIKNFIITQELENKQK